MLNRSALMWTAGVVTLAVVATGLIGLSSTTRPSAGPAAEVSAPVQGPRPVVSPTGSPSVSVSPRANVAPTKEQAALAASITHGQMTVAQASVLIVDAGWSVQVVAVDGVATSAPRGDVQPGRFNLSVEGQGDSGRVIGVTIS
jgi:hypothetical protein